MAITTFNEDDSISVLRFGDEDSDIVGDQEVCFQFANTDFSGHHEAGLMACGGGGGGGY